MYYQPTPSTSVPIPVAKLCRLAGIERSVNQSLVRFKQQSTTAAAPGESHTRSALHARKVPFMRSTEYISTEKSRFQPTYIEFMEAKDEFDDNLPCHSRHISCSFSSRSKSQRARPSQVVVTSNSVPQDFPAARANSPKPVLTNALFSSLLQGVMQEVVGMARVNYSLNTVAHFLHNIPDFTYIAGESFLFDLFMTMVKIFK